MLGLPLSESKSGAEALSGIPTTCVIRAAARTRSVWMGAARLIAPGRLHAVGPCGNDGLAEMLVQVGIHHEKERVHD